MATPPRRRITDSRVTRLLSVLTGMMAGSMAFSASLPVAKPEAAGMSSVRLARIGAALNSDIERGLLPGAVVAVVRRGKLVYYESFGSVQKDSIFTIASMTKPLTASGATTSKSRVSFSCASTPASARPRNPAAPVMRTRMGKAYGAIR